MKRNWMRATTGVLSAIMMASAMTSGFANTTAYAATEHFNDASKDSTDWANWKTNWDSYSSNYENVSLTPGATESQLNFGWYSATQETPKVRIGTVEAIDETNSTEFSGSQTDAVEISSTQYYSSKVTVTGLVENTKYYYQVYKDGAWQDVQQYSTKSFSNFSFLYVGDPQIGASKGQTTSESDKLVAASSATSTAEANLAARNDSYNWNKILNDAVTDHPDVSFILSAGDQVNAGKNEREYAGYLGADVLKSLPVSTTIGNHDSSSAQYSMHFNNPNTQTDEQTTTGKTAAGTDYYYTYGDVLFIVLDTNNYNCATHKNVMEKATSENPNVKWRVVMFHQDIFGSGYDHSDSDGMVLRTQLTPLMDEYDIDVVLQGHDHTYSRTFQLQGDGQQHTAFDKSYSSAADYKEQNNCYQIVDNTQSGTVVNPQGTVYLEANSATGSKFYNLIQQKQDYISERSQTWTPSYSVITVTDESFSVSTYDTTTRNALTGSSTYTIVKKEETPAAEKAETTINATESYTKTVGDGAFTLDAKAANNAALTYESSDENIAIVSSKGKVSVIGQGTAVIKVTSAETDTEKSATKNITVTVNPAAQTPAQTPAAPGQTAENTTAKQEQVLTGTDRYVKSYGCRQFKLNVKNSGDGALTYKSSNSKVVKVDKSGKITVAGCGRAKITVTAASTNTYEKSSMQITVIVNPKKQVAKLAARKNGNLLVTWKKDTKASGYEIVYSYDKNFKNNITIKSVSKNTTSKLTVSKLKKNKVIYVKVRAYKKIAGGEILYGNYSNIVKVRVK